MNSINCYSCNSEVTNGVVHEGKKFCHSCTKKMKKCSECDIFSSINNKCHKCGSLNDVCNIKIE